MPTIVSDKERLQLLLTQPTSLLRDALCTDNPGNVERLKEIFITKVEDSKQYSPTATWKQKALVDMRVKFCDLFYQTYHSICEQDSEVDNPLALDDVPALVRRLKAFLGFLQSEAKGFKGKGHPSVKTMAEYVYYILLMVQDRLEKTFDASRVKQEKKRVMQYSGDGKQGVHQSIYSHAEYLCKRYDLPVKVFDRPPYRWNKGSPPP